MASETIMTAVTNEDEIEPVYLDDQLFSLQTLLLRPSPFGHTRCGDGDMLDYRAINPEVLEPSSPLGPQARQPTMAMLDDLLKERIRYGLEDFLHDHRDIELRDKVDQKARDLLDRKDGTDRLFCTANPECHVTIHDWRIRVLEPLIMFLLQKYYEKVGNPMELPPGRKPRYRLVLRHQAPPEPAGVTFALADISKETHLSSVRIQFDLDSSILSFGLQPNFFVRAMVKLNGRSEMR